MNEIIRSMPSVYEEHRLRINQLVELSSSAERLDRQRVKDIIGRIGAAPYRITRLGVKCHKVIGPKGEDFVPRDLLVPHTHRITYGLKDDGTFVINIAGCIERFDNLTCSACGLPIRNAKLDRTCKSLIFRCPRGHEMHGPAVSEAAPG